MNVSKNSKNQITNNKQISNLNSSNFNIWRNLSGGTLWENLNIEIYLGFAFCHLEFITDSFSA